MSAGSQTLRLMILGAISEMPKEEQGEVHVAADKLRAVIAEADEKTPGAGTTALALVGLEAQIAAEEEEHA